MSIHKANLERIAANVIESLEHKVPRSPPCALDGVVYTGDRTALPKKMRVGSGAPSFCWHCNRQLQRAPGKGLNLFYFNNVVDKVGVEHRVHGDCTKLAIDDGAKVLL